MKKQNRKNITTPKHYWFSLYSEITGEQDGYTCLAKDVCQAERKMRKDLGKHIGIADYDAFEDMEV